MFLKLDPIEGLFVTTVATTITCAIAVFMFLIAYFNRQSINNLEKKIIEFNNLFTEIKNSLNKKETS